MANALGRLLATKVDEAPSTAVRLRRDAEGALVLGGIEHPFPAAGTAEHAAAIEQLEGLVGREGERLRLVARPGDLLPCSRLLADLDRGHAITVEAVLEVFDPRLPEAVEALDAVARLAALGLAVRVCPVVAEKTPSADALRLLYGAVALSGGFEVRWVAAGGRRARGEAQLESFAESCRYLSLLHEFPRPVIGRG
jgi:hypothetical protein